MIFHCDEYCESTIWIKLELVESGSNSCSNKPEIIHRLKVLQLQYQMEIKMNQAPEETSFGVVKVLATCCRTVMNTPANPIKGDDEGRANLSADGVDVDG